MLNSIAADWDEYNKDGKGMFLGKIDHTIQIRQSGTGLLVTPAEHCKIRGFYMKHGEHLY